MAMYTKVNINNNSTWLTTEILFKEMKSIHYNIKYYRYYLFQQITNKLHTLRLLVNYFTTDEADNY